MVLVLAPLAFATPFDRPWALGGYAAARDGSYAAGGVGGRARWEPGPVGVETYLEATVVDWPGGFRHDYPNGFTVYLPLGGDRLRVRPGLGFCDVVSLVEPTQPGAPRADDVLLGAHAALGSELALSEGWSVFADAQVDVYAGHDRASGAWTGAVAESLQPFWTAQLNVGVQLHLASLR